MILFLQRLDLVIDEAHGDSFTTNSLFLQIVNFLKEVFDLILSKEFIQLLLVD